MSVIICPAWTQKYMYILLSWPPSTQYGPDVFVICYDLNASLLYQINKKTSIIL